MTQQHFFTFFKKHPPGRNRHPPAKFPHRACCRPGRSRRREGLCSAPQRWGRLERSTAGCCTSLWEGGGQRNQVWVIKPESLETSYKRQTHLKPGGGANKNTSQYAVHLHDGKLKVLLCEWTLDAERYSAWASFEYSVPSSSSFILD